MSFPVVHEDGEIWNGAAVTSLEARAAAYVYVPASGDNTGATDLALINSLLAANRRIMGVPGSVYYIDGPVQPVSGSVLDMRGCTINNESATSYMLQNYAANLSNAITTGTDGASTSGSTTLVSATLAAVAGAGDTIAVHGAGVGGSTWYGIVASVSSPNVVLGNKARTTIASGATWYRWTAASRDKDITVIGGYWQNGTWSNTAGSVFRFRRVDRLTMRDVTIGGSGSASSLRLTVHAGDITQATFNAIHFDNVKSDGLHIMGPASYVHISNITGTTGDDMIALSTCDGYNPTTYDCQGNLSDITVDGVYPNGSLKAVHPYDDDASHDFTNTGLSIKNAYGSTTAEGIRIDGAGSTMSGLSIENVAISVNGASYAMIQLGQYSIVDADIRNATWVSSTSATLGIIDAGQPGQNIYVHGLRFATNPGGTNIGLNLGNSTVYDVLLEDVVALYGSTSAFIPLQFGGGTYTLVTLRHVYARVTGPLVKFNAATTVTNLHLDDIVASLTTGITIPTGQAACTIRASNVQFTGTNFITSLSPFNLYAQNFNVNTTGPVIALTTTNSTPVNLTYTNYAQAGAGADTSKDGAQVITLNKATYTTTTP